MVDRVDIGDWCTLYHADSTKIIDVLREHEPDAVIMDPPYGIGYQHSGGGIGKHSRRNDNQSLPGDAHGVSIKPWVLGFSNVLTWGANHYADQVFSRSCGRWLAWDKLSGLQPWDSFSDVEFAWHSRPGKSTLISHLWKGIASAKECEEGGRRFHPTQKPVRVMQWCIRECRLVPGATILDPYMGSGTTGIAAFGLDMRFVGVEIERRWFDAAVARIRDRCRPGLFPR